MTAAPIRATPIADCVDRESGDHSECQGERDCGRQDGGADRGWDSEPSVAKARVGQVGQREVSPTQICSIEARSLE